MSTVPNWIAKAVIYEPHDYGRSARVINTTGWRSTRMQVIVTCDGPRGPIERRFGLADLTEIRQRDSWTSRARLMEPSDPKVVEAKSGMACRAAVSDLKTVIEETRLDPSVMDAEALVVAIGRIQRAATKAMADLSEVL